MPSSCVARGCPCRCTQEYRSLGITFHRVPKDVVLRKNWEKALKRNSISDFIRVCSKHFKPEDFDRTGQTVRLRDGVVPSVFTYPANPPTDHSYALPASMSHLRARLCEALERVESLEREKRNAKDQERQTKRLVHSLLEDLREKNLINNELKRKLSLYPGQ